MHLLVRDLFKFFADFFCKDEQKTCLTKACYDFKLKYIEFSKIINQQILPIKKTFKSPILCIINRS